MKQIKDIDGMIGKTISRVIFDSDIFHSQMFIEFDGGDYILIDSRSYEGSSEIEVSQDEIKTLDEKLRYGLIEYKDYLIEKQKKKEEYIKSEREYKLRMLEKLKKELGE